MCSIPRRTLETVGLREGFSFFKASRVCIHGEKHCSEGICCSLVQHWNRHVPSLLVPETAFLLGRCQCKSWWGVAGPAQDLLSLSCLCKIPNWFLRWRPVLLGRIQGDCRWIQRQESSTSSYTSMPPWIMCIFAKTVSSRAYERQGLLPDAQFSLASGPSFVVHS